MKTRCRFVNRHGQRCSHPRGHGGAHDAMLIFVEPSCPTDLDDPSEDVMAYQERRDEELREEEPNP
jgi:hypothetical protein